MASSSTKHRSLFVVPVVVLTFAFVLVVSAGVVPTTGTEAERGSRRVKRQLGPSVTLQDRLESVHPAVWSQQMYGFSPSSEESEVESSVVEPASTVVEANETADKRQANRILCYLADANGVIQRKLSDNVYTSTDALASAGVTFDALRRAEEATAGGEMAGGEISGGLPSLLAARDVGEQQFGPAGPSVSLESWLRRVQHALRLNRRLGRLGRLNADGLCRCPV